MKIKVLWIEDSARYEYSSWVAPIYYSGDYDFQIAENVSKAIDYLESDEYDVIIADLRLPPGNDAYWKSLYDRATNPQRRAALGLEFLSWLLGQDGVRYARKPPAWAHAERIVVFTVEVQNQVSQDLKRLGIRHFEQKTAGHPDTILVDLIQRVISKRDNNNA